MRKTLALFISVLLVFLSLYSVIFIENNKEKENVTVTENYIYGDKRFADNVNIDFNMQYCENLLWKINYRIIDGKTKTDFSIHKNRIKRDYHAENELNLYTVLHYSSSGISFEETGIDKAYKELINEAEPYVEARKTVTLSDYLEYYPISLDSTFMGKIHYNSQFGSSDSDEEKLVTALRNFFRIPVLKNHKVVINVSVDENRNVNHTGSTGFDGIEEFEEFDFFAESAITDKDCFIYFSNRSKFGNPVDTSKIPGGYGIYRLPYSYSEDNSKILFDSENLKNIFPVDKNEEITELKLSTDKKDLYMISNNGDTSYLTVIDTESYAEKEKIILSKSKKQDSFIGYIDKDFLVINHYHENTEDSFSVYLPDEKGGFKENFTNYNYVLDEQYKDTNSDKFAGSSIYLNTEYDVKWDGENLYVTNGITQSSTPTERSGFTLSIYNKDGLQFCGEYTTSLSTGFNGYQNSRYYIQRFFNDRIKINFT